LPLRPFKQGLSGFFVPRGPVRESSRSIAICHEKVLILANDLANARVVDFSFLLVYLFPSAIMLSVLKTHSGLEDDVFVEAQEVRSLFIPSIKKTKFHSLLKAGVIVGCRHVKGRYMLNKTRINLGLPPVDVKAFREQRELGLN
jgi:hypothetical protein